MTLEELNISGVYAIHMSPFSDERGTFVKPFQKEIFASNGLEVEFQENFYTTNKKGVVRGMHFQNPPYDQAKLVYVVSGEIVDVLLDLRKDSPTYGKYLEIKLSAENHKALYVPRGMAHGYCCLTDAVVVYLSSSSYNQVADDGIHYNSFGYDWPAQDLILSERDQSLIEWDQYNSPF